MQNQKFRLKKEFEESQIIINSGNGFLITKESFNDYFAQKIIEAGMAHLIELNPFYKVEIDIEKKTFNQVTENVIALTYEPLPEDSKKQEKTQRERKQRSDVGKPRTQKG